VQWTWLECVAIDRSTAYRGIAIVERTHVPQVQDVAVYRPVTACRQPGR
jgi:hypothetical protein